jgi:hypothetical protein
MVVKLVLPLRRRGVGKIRTFAPQSDGAFVNKGAASASH